MRVRLGINTCFAVKRWPRPGDWARIVRDELGLEVVELSLDLIEDVGGKAAGQVRSALDEYGLRAETVFTGLAAYSLNLLMHPDEERRRAATDWYLSVVDLAARVGIPAFEQDDARALADLRTSAEFWQAALTERGAR